MSGQVQLHRIRVRVKPARLPVAVHEIVARIDPTKDVLEQLTRIPQYGCSPVENMMGENGYLGLNAPIWVKVLSFKPEPEK